MTETATILTDRNNINKKIKYIKKNHCIAILKI